MRLLGVKVDAFERQNPVFFRKTEVARFAIRVKSGSVDDVTRLAIARRCFKRPAILAEIGDALMNSYALA